MKITEIDRNFQIKTEFSQEGLKWYDVRQPPFTVMGVEYDETRGCYLRMPQEIASMISVGVETLNHCTSGGRVYFQTDSPAIAIEAQMILDESMAHMTYSCQAGFDLYEKVGQNWVYLNTFIPKVGMTDGYCSLLQTSGQLTEYMIYFPLYSGVRQLCVAVYEDAQLSASQAVPTSLPLVFYGSSITQGGCASRPGTCYPAMVSRRLGTDFRNLGFSGACLAEPPMMKYLAEIPMGAFIYDYDFNAPDPVHLQHSHWAGYKTVRAAHPNTPIVLMSAPDGGSDDGILAKRRSIIQETYEMAKSEGDAHICYLSGDKLFDADERDSCTVDTRHPNDLGFYRMAVQVEKALSGLLYEVYG